jgi:hypothetical protein
MAEKALRIRRALKHMQSRLLPASNRVVVVHTCGHVSLMPRGRNWQMAQRQECPGCYWIDAQARGIRR